MKHTWRGFISDIMSAIRAITISDLAALEPLLRASFGRGDFDTQDEFEVFAETQPKNWFALSDGEPQGFIRSFPLTQDLVLCELYVPPGPERAARLTRLLEHFRRHHRFPVGTTLRLDVLEEDSELLDVLESLFPHSSTKTFAHYRITPPSKAAVQAPPAPLTSDDYKEAQAILAVLKRYNVPELEQLAARKQLFVIKDSGVKAVLHVEHDGQGGLEVITLATAQGHLRQGYASTLLNGFLRTQPGRRIVLKVDVENRAAISLYERAGFARESDRTEIWWYLQLDHP